MCSYEFANQNIKILMQHRGWTIDTFCEKTGLSIETFRKKLRSNEGWTLVEAVKIANTLDVSVSDLFFARLVPSVS